jgi:hypothetical protein
VDHGYTPQLQSVSRLLPQTAEIATNRTSFSSIAESIIQTTAQSRYGMSHDHSALAEILAGHDSRKQGLSIPEGVKRQLQNSASDRASVLKSGEKILLRYTLLGVDCDTEWDKLPRATRHFLLERCCGELGLISEDQSSFIRSRFYGDKSLGIDEYLARCQLGASLVSLINTFVRALEADMSHRFRPEPPELLLNASYFLSTNGSKKTYLDLLKQPFFQIHHSMKICIKFVVVSLVADPEYQRELDYLICEMPAIIRWPLTCVLNGIWIYCKTLQRIILPLFLVCYLNFSSPTYCKIYMS